MPNSEDCAAWQLAFAKQARADLNAWARLEPMQDVAACCKLVFLYMACEKLAKAYLCSSGSDPDLIQSSHGYVSKVLPVITRQEYGLLVGRSPGRSNRKLQELKILAQEIAVLSPSVDRERRPDNCEYP